MKENGFYFKDEENIWLGLKSNSEDLLVLDIGKDIVCNGINSI